MAKKTATPVPEGYLENAQGHLVPVNLVDPLDKLRDELVRGILDRVLGAQDLLKSAKEDAMMEISDFIELAASEYNTEVGGAKGNVTLRTFNGDAEIRIQVADRIVFDERIQVAKKIVDECIHRWAEDANDNVKALVEHAFQTDKEGRLSIGRIIALTRLDIDDERWQEAMRAIRDSQSVASSCQYLRIYQRDEKGQQQRVNTDLSTL
jgi:hypothetical protein